MLEITPKPESVPTNNILPAPSKSDLMLLSGQTILTNTSGLTDRYDPNYEYTTPQSWEAKESTFSGGNGVYLRMEDGSWHIDLFAFDETTPPRVDEFDLKKWDWPSMGAAQGHDEYFFGRFHLATYGESVSLHVAVPGHKDLAYRQESEATYKGQDILIFTGQPNKWDKSPSVGEGVLSLYRGYGEQIRITTRLFPDAAGVISFLDQLTQDRLSDNDRALFWKVAEEQLTALATAKAEREAYLTELGI